MDYSFERLYFKLTAVGSHLLCSSIEGNVDVLSTLFILCRLQFHVYIF